MIYPAIKNRMYMHPKIKLDLSVPMNEIVYSTLTIDTTQYRLCKQVNKGGYE